MFCSPDSVLPEKSVEHLRSALQMSRWCSELKLPSETFQTGKLTEGGRNRNASPSPSESNENINQSTKARAGRSQESKNFAEDEVTALVALVHELKPAGADQWEKLGLELCAREKELCQSLPFSPKFGAS